MANDRPIRCAIYTRKSSEEGLDQDFNSLDAQYEACAAYVLSQRHEGWTLLPERYDDGGYSGGTMNRPGIQQLMSAMQAGAIDVIVVYKVDRLTRSLADFAKMVEILDAAGASFVSITQSFNTTTSMGRLTLNVLLSFAQFEREVTGERIRDKIAASKAKGMWMGGRVPLGYDVCERRLVVNHDEAITVRHIFTRYAALRSANLLQEEMAATGFATKLTKLRTGAVQGGEAFRLGGLLHVLNNRLYVGEIQHKGRYHPGEHEPIVSLEIWDAAQAALAENRVARRDGTRARHPSLLTRLLRDQDGRPMYPSHANKNGKRYRYYVTHSKHQTADCPTLRLPAHELENLVRHNLAMALSDESQIANAVAHGLEADSLRTLIADAAADGKALASAEANGRSLIVKWVARIDLSDASATITLKLGDDIEHRIAFAMAKHRRGADVKLVVNASQSRPRDEQLCLLMADAHAAQARMVADPHLGLNQLAQAAGVGTARLKKLLRLSFLAPDIVESALDGRQPASMTAPMLNTIATLPLDWVGQRALLGAAQPESI